MARNVGIPINPYKGVSGVTSGVVAVWDAAEWAYSVTSSSGTFELTPEVSIDITHNRDLVAESTWSALADVDASSPKVQLGPQGVRWFRFVSDSNTTAVDAFVHKITR